MHFVGLAKTKIMLEKFLILAGKIILSVFLAKFLQE